MSWFIWQVEGDVLYNGHTPNEFQPRKTSVYVSQDDLHNMGELSVQEKRWTTRLLRQFSLFRVLVAAWYVYYTECILRKESESDLKSKSVDLNSSFLKYPWLHDVLKVVVR